VSNFWDIVWLMVSTFFFIAYLIIMFQIVVDLFRDGELGGGAKVLWVVGLIFLPVITAIVYIVSRGKGMATRQQASLQKAKTDTETYIRDVAGRTPASQIAEAKALLDAGTITSAEFERLKAKALA
jgi:ABC-type multidrug transport system fused ATPase/permease subunit